MIVVQPVVARSIANLLVENGVLEDTTVSRTSVASSESGRNLLATLVEFGHVTEDQITDVIGQFYGLKKVSFKSKDEINPEALAELPDTFITKNRILPFDVDDNLLKVAVANPANLAMMGNVRVITEKRLNRMSQVSASCKICLPNSLIWEQRQRSFRLPRFSSIKTSQPLP
jgi:hypothetical protein